MTKSDETEMEKSGRKHPFTKQRRNSKHKLDGDVSKDVEVPTDILDKLEKITALDPKKTNSKDKEKRLAKRMKHKSDSRPKDSKGEKKRFWEPRSKNTGDLIPTPEKLVEPIGDSPSELQGLSFVNQH